MQKSTDDFLLGGNGYDCIYVERSKVTALLKYVTFMLLALGLVWCAYFLVLGIIFICQADYRRFCYMLF